MFRYDKQPIPPPRHVLVGTSGPCKLLIKLSRYPRIEESEQQTESVIHTTIVHSKYSVVIQVRRDMKATRDTEAETCACILNPLN